MKSLIKIVGTVVLALLVIVVALGLAVILIFNPNDYKSEIQQLARDKAQMELTLAGDMDWSLFPLGLSVRQARLASVNTPDQPFASVKTLGLSLDLWPLLQRQVQVRAIHVDGLEVTLERDARGRGNWEGPGAQDNTGRAAASSSVPASGTPQASVPPSAPRQIAIDSLRIQNARVRYTDARSGLHLLAENVQLDSQIQGATGSFTPAAVRTLDVKLNARADRLTVDGVPFDKVQVQAHAAGGLIDVTALQAALYGGRIDADGSLDVRQPQAVLRARTKVTDVPLERLLEKPGRQSPVRGALSLAADLQTHGHDRRAWLAGLQGQGDFTVRQAVLPNVNLEQQLCRGIALLNRKTPRPAVGSPNTSIQELSGSLTVDQGRVRNPDLRARMLGVALAGNGSIDLVRLYSDYRLDVQIEGDLASADPACKVNPRIIGLALPVRCRGALQAGGQRCNLDTTGVMRMTSRWLGDSLNGQVGKNLEQLIGKELGEKALPQVQNALRGLFK